MYHSVLYNIRFYQFASIYDILQISKGYKLYRVCPGRHTIYLSTIFGTIFRHSRWLMAMTYVFTVFMVTLLFLSETERDGPYRDIAKIVWKPHSHRVIFTTSAQKSRDIRAMSLQVPYDYLRSLRSFLTPKCQSRILQCPQDQSAIPVRGSCDLLAMFLWATGLRFFKMCHSAELNKIVQATMSVNPYDDRRVSYGDAHGKGDLDIVWAS